jgi:hypothetical protein
MVCGLVNQRLERLPGPHAQRPKIDHVDQLGSLYLGGFHRRDVLEFEPKPTTLLTGIT